MLALLFGNPVAFALVCDPGDAACTDANELRDRINALQPGAIADAHPKVRRRTGRIRRTLQAIYAAADDGSCTMDGLSAFVYNAGASTGEWSRGGNSGTTVGAYVGGGFSATYNGDSSGSIGDFGIYKIDKLAANWDADDAYIGSFIRTIGLGGVGFAAIGSCPDPVQEVFAAYFPQLSGIVEPEPPVSDAGAGFLRVQVLDAAAGGASTSASYSIAFSLGGATTPAVSSSNLLNPPIPVP